MCESKLKATRPRSSHFIFGGSKGHISHLLLLRLTFSFSLCTGAGSQYPVVEAGILLGSSFPGCTSSDQTGWDEIQSICHGFFATLMITHHVDQHGFSPGAYYPVSQKCAWIHFHLEGSGKGSSLPAKLPRCPSIYPSICPSIPRMDGRAASRGKLEPQMLAQWSFQPWGGGLLSKQKNNCMF